MNRWGRPAVGENRCARCTRFGRIVSLFWNHGIFTYACPAHLAEVRSWADPWPDPEWEEDE